MGKGACGCRRRGRGVVKGSGSVATVRRSGGVTTVEKGENEKRYEDAKVQALNDEDDGGGREGDLAARRPR